MRTRTWGGLVLAALGAACADSSGGTDPRENVAVQAQARLQAFDSCAALEAYIEDTAVHDMRTQLELSKQSVRGGPGGGFLNGGIPSAAPPAADMASGAPETASAGAAPTDYTTTNTQVAGVDEADFVKNDGTRILVLSGDRLYLHRSWPPTALARAGELPIEGWPREMFLDEKDRVVVFSSVYEPRPGAAGGGGVDGARRTSPRRPSARPCPAATPRATPPR